LWIYWTFTDTPPARPERPALEQLPRRHESATQPLRVGEAVEIPAGGKIMFRRYDEHTGRPRDMFVCQDWQPVPGSKNEIRVTRPELSLLLTTGMTASITADLGQIRVERVDQSQMRPRNGWLDGQVRVTVDRRPGPDRPPPVDRPEDLITVSVDRLEFDLEIGELKTDSRVTVDSDDFEVRGRGLHLIWNQADNRIETLSIAEGEEFVLYAAAGLFGMAASDQLERTPSGGPAATEPAPDRPRRGPRRRPLRPPTAYTCRLDGGVVAEQYRALERIGGLEADQVELLFDVASGAERLLRGRGSSTGPSTQPISQVGSQPRDRLVLRWQGRLQLEPADPCGPEEPNRRRVVATGRPVIMTRGDATVRCAKIAFHDDQQRVWLYPAETGQVELAMGPRLSASAQSVYVDQAARVIKLVGQVELHSQRGTGLGARLSSVRSSHWAELRLARSLRPLEESDPLMNANALESASFVGDVQVDLGRQKLTAHQLDVTFHPRRGQQSLEELLEAASAWGEVRLTSGDGLLGAVRLDLAFGLTEDHELYPTRMDALGAVTITRGKASIRGNRISARLAPPPNGSRGGRPLFVVQELDVSGGAELLDPDNRIAARGQRILANFEGINQLATASVSGATGQPGLVHARPYTVWGQCVELDRQAQTVRVDGPSRLSFKTQRSLQGQRRDQPAPVVVTASRGLLIDGRRNTVHFDGDVLARTGEEQLQGQTLTLLLEDVEETRSAPAEPSLRELWRQLRRLLGGQEPPPAGDELLALRVEGPAERLRKEPLRLVAENALVTSESFEPGDPEPVIHASISAPLLEADLVNRQIVTTGLTDLLITDRHGLQEPEPARELLGVPSALISRGPSQTAMRCAGRMTYKLGEDGPNRLDTAVFEDRVVFIHRAGRDMVDLGQMLPRLADQPDLLDMVQSRNATLDCDRLECWFIVDPTDTRFQRGGGLTRAPLRLASLTASGSVYLRDQQGSRVREIHAGWIEFNRQQGRIRLRGAQPAEARVYLEDTQTGQFDVHSGQQLVINLHDGTVRSDKLVGELRRP